jgi:cysteinyl-tRNA synthetase
MAKSAGNFYTLRDLQQEGYQPEVVRYLLASVPYRKKLNFTFDGLKAAATAIDRLRNFKLRLETDKYPDGTNEKILQRTQAAARQFEESLDDDLNTAEALAALFEFVRDANTDMDAGEFRAGNTAPSLDLLERFDRIFAVLEPTKMEGGWSDARVEALVQQRADAKKARNFARSDQIRQELLDAGIVLEDTKEGMRWKRK